MYGFLDLLLDFSAAAMSPEARVVSSNQQKPSFDTYRRALTPNQAVQ
jgi:hypothetical protein